MNDELMTVKTISKRLMCSVAHVYALIDARELLCYKIGLGSQGGIRISEEQLKTYLESKRVYEKVALKHIKI